MARLTIENAALLETQPLSVSVERTIGGVHMTDTLKLSTKPEGILVASIRFTAEEVQLIASLLSASVPREY
jgi:hypothetical protein